MDGARLFFTKLLWQLLQVLAMYVRQHAAQPPRRRAGSPIPEARGQGGVCGGRVRQDTSSQQGYFGEALPTLRGKDELPGRPQHVFGPQGEPFHRPAIPRPRLRLRSTAWEGGGEHQGFGKGGSRMTAQGKVGAPCGASGNTRWSQNCVATRQGFSRMPPCQVSRRSGGVAASVRPL